MIVGVIGSGSIGPDLAYGFVSALAGDAGSTVYLHDISKDALEAGTTRIRGYVGKTLARGRLSARAAEAIEKRLVPTLEANDLARCDYVLEAATEDLATKRKILARLESVVRPDCLIGFATSGIPRSEIAVNALHPERCFVNHPFFPAWRTLPIEVVLSGDEALGKRMLDTLVTLGKVPIVTAGDVVSAARDLIRAHLAGTTRIGAVNPAPVAVPHPLPVVNVGGHSLATDAILVDVVRRGLAQDLADGLLIEAEGFGRCRATVDMDIGMKNFMQNGPRVPAAFLNE